VEAADLAVKDGTGDHGPGRTQRTGCGGAGWPHRSSRPGSDAADRHVLVHRRPAANFDAIGDV
jgi:hypothetical protein